MDTFFRGYHVPIAHVLRDAAAASGATLIACWMVLLVQEAIRSGNWIPNLQSYNQALVLAVVFASYAIGWRQELVGAILALAGTAIFFAVGYAGANLLPPLPAIWLAAPGVLYLLAWVCKDRPHRIVKHFSKD